MIEKFIDIFLKAAKPLQKLWIFIIFIVAILFVDYFTSWPSITFTKDKYEAIEVMNNVYTDTTIDSTVRNKAYKDIIQLSNRLSVREHTIILISKIKEVVYLTPELAYPIKLDKNPTIKEYFFFIIKSMWYLYCSFGLFLGLVHIFHSIGKEINLQIGAYILLYSVIIISYILALFASSTFPEHPYLAAFITQVIYLIVIMFILILVKVFIDKRKDYKTNQKNQSKRV